MAVLLAERALLAQGVSPWVDEVNNLSTAFTGPIARGLALVAIVVGGVMFAFARTARPQPRRYPAAPDLGDAARSRDQWDSLGRYRSTLGTCRS